MGLSLTSSTCPLTPKSGVEKSQFDIAGKRLEIDENVKHSTFDKTFSGSDFSLEQSYSFHQSPKITERRSNTICTAVERPDHHCGKDNVSYCCY